MLVEQVHHILAYLFLNCHQKDLDPAFRFLLNGTGDWYVFKKNRALKHVANLTLTKSNTHISLFLKLLVFRLMTY